MLLAAAERGDAYAQYQAGKLDREGYFLPRDDAGAKMFGEGVAGQISYQQFQMLQQARRLFDQASYYWQRDVVGYDQDRQQSSLFKWFNIQSVYQQVMVMFVTLVSVLALLGLWRWWRRRRVWDKHDWIMVQLSNRLAKKDKTLARQDSEGVLAWLTRLEPKVSDKAALQALAALYRQIRYQQPTDNKQPIRQLDSLAKTIALKKPH